MLFPASHFTDGDFDNFCPFFFIDFQYSFWVIFCLLTNWSIVAALAYSTFLPAVFWLKSFLDAQFCFWNQN